MIQSKLIYTQIGKKTRSGKWAVAFVGEGPERLPYSTVRRARDAKRTIHKKKNPNLGMARMAFLFSFCAFRLENRLPCSATKICNSYSLNEDRHFRKESDSGGVN